MDSQLPTNPIQATLEDLTQAAASLQADLATNEDHSNRPAYPEGRAHRQGTDGDRQYEGLPERESSRVLCDHTIPVQDQ